MRFFMFVLLAFAFVLPSYGSEPVEFDQVVQKLTTKNFKKKIQLIESIALSGDDRALPIMQALSQGDLFYLKDSKQVVIGKSTDVGYEITNIESMGVGSETSQASTLKIVSKSELRKVKINNKMRRSLRGLMAALELTSKVIDTRLAAAKNIIRSPSEDVLPYLEMAIEKELDEDAKQMMQVARGVILSKSNNAEVRLEGVNAMSGFPDQDVKGILANMLAKDEAGEYQEKDAAVVAAAEQAMKILDRKESFYKVIENMFFGLSAGSVLLLAAVGLAVTFGVMGVINMAHGEMIMLGAYTTYVIQLLMPNSIEYSLLVAIPAAFLVSGMFGVVLERTVIRFLYGRPLETLLATFGVSLILQQLVRSVFSPLNRSVTTPEWMSGSWEINGMLSLTYNRLYIVIFSLLVLGGLLLLLKKSHFGLQMRAVTQNRAMASSMGIRTGWVDALTFGLGSGIAGIAGVAISQLTNVGPNLGQAYIIDSFMVVVFGGVGNLFGTLFGAMSLGIANKFVEPFTGAVIAKILILVFIILFIQRRPRGMFALKGRFVED